MKLHRHIIRANAMLDTLQREVGLLPGVDPEDVREANEIIDTIRGDLNHVDRKLAAFNRIVLDVLTSE